MKLVLFNIRYLVSFASTKYNVRVLNVGVVLRALQDRIQIQQWGGGLDKWQNVLWLQVTKWWLGSTRTIGVEYSTYYLPKNIKIEYSLYICQIYTASLLLYAIMLVRNGIIGIDSPQHNISKGDASHLKLLRNLNQHCRVL